MLETNAELSLSENIKTPISKNLVIGKAWYSINIRHFNECQFACWHMHVCSVEVSVSMQRPGVKVRYCPQLFSTLFFEARSLSVPGVSLAIYSLGDSPTHVSWELWSQVPPCLPCFHNGSGDPDSSHAFQTASSPTGPSTQVLVDNFWAFPKNLKHIW